MSAYNKTHTHINTDTYTCIHIERYKHKDSVNSSGRSALHIERPAQLDCYLRSSRNVEQMH